jgi:amino acid transporter
MRKLSILKEITIFGNIALFFYLFFNLYIQNYALHSMPIFWNTMFVIFISIALNTYLLFTLDKGKRGRWIKSLLKGITILGNIAFLFFVLLAILGEAISTNSPSLTLHWCIIVLIILNTYLLFALNKGKRGRWIKSLPKEKVLEERTEIRNIK